MKGSTFILLGAALILFGCALEPPEEPRKQGSAPAEVKKIAAGPNVWVEIQGERRRVGLQARVCLREGQLEQFLCRKNTKEHEAILAADLDARDIHKALLLTGAQPGSPVRFQPKFKPASGTRIRVS